MSWNDEEYFEEGEFGPEIAALKDAVKANLRATIRAEMERLRRENAELQDIKGRWDALKREQAEGQRKLRETMHNAEAAAKKARLEELITASDVCVWGVRRLYTQRPKCNACDTYRRIVYTNPQGREKSDMCECDDHEEIFEPAPYLCVETGFTQSGKRSRRVLQGHPLVGQQKRHHQSGRKQHLPAHSHPAWDRGELSRSKAKRRGLFPRMGGL